MNLAIAVESKQHPKNQNDYRVWYLEIDECGQVVGVGVKSKQEMVENLFENYRKTGKSNWRAFQKSAERSTPVEIFDFVSMNMHDNTHFGNLPSLSEFQNVLDHGVELDRRETRRALLPAPVARATSATSTRRPAYW